MSLSLNINDAMDLVDEYGADPELWPAEYSDTLKDMMAADEDFADYVETAKRIDDMLDQWEMDDDGAQIDLSDLEEDQDEDDGQDADQDGDGITMPAGAAGDTDASQGMPEDDDHILEINMDDIQQLGDMDEMFANIIRKQFENTSGETFNVFTRDYDVMPEITVPAAESIDPITQQVAKSVGPLMKDLRRLIAARSQAKRSPGKRRGKLHGPNLHRILAGDDRVFFRKEEAQSLDTAIMLNLDFSGSMAGGRLKLAAETAFALGSVLNKLGIAFECLGFTTAEGSHFHPDCRTQKYNDEVRASNEIRPVHRYTPIMMPKLKGFDERWLPNVQRRFAFIYNNRGSKIGNNVDFGGTPEGCGNEFAARRLLQRKEARKIMITMTDGEPAAPIFNYKDGNENRRHSANMVKMIEAAGIDLIGIGIQHSGPKQYYTNSMVINSIDEMPAQLLGLLKKLLLGK